MKKKKAGLLLLILFLFCAGMVACGGAEKKRELTPGETPAEGEPLGVPKGGVTKPPLSDVSPPPAPTAPPVKDKTAPTVLPPKKPPDASPPPAPPAPPVKDKTPPSVTSTTPGKGEQNVDPDVTLVVKFSEEMSHAGIIETASLKLDPVAEEIASYHVPGTNTYKFDFKKLNEGTTYTAQVSGEVMDKSGNKMGTPFKWKFTTVPLKLSFTNEVSAKAEPVLVSVPVSRYYHPGTGDNFYTTEKGPFSGYSLIKQDAFYAYSWAAPKTVEVNWWFNGTDNLYNIGTAEHPTDYGYTYKGTAFYAYGYPPPPGVKTTPVFRLYNPSSGDHFFTADPAEKDSVMGLSGSGRYMWEGVEWYAPSSSQFLNDPVPIYRWLTHTPSHFYTTSSEEGNYLMSVQKNWVSEGTAFMAYNAPKTGTCVPIYRFRGWVGNPKKGKPDYLYTRDKAEGDAAGYDYQGIAFYAEPKEVSGTTAVYRYYNSDNGDHFYTTAPGSEQLGGYTYKRIEWYAPK